MGTDANVNAIFYADSYHPIQAGSIDGTDITPHDNGVYRALLCATAGLYDPTGDPKIIGDPYCTIFVGRLSHTTTEECLREAMSKYGQVKNLRLVRHIVTGASRGYAFVEYETEREMQHAYEAAHHSIIDGSQVIVDYSRQQLMPGWIPRRLGGGLGGRKESGQLRFGGRERPFRAPLYALKHNLEAVFLTLLFVSCNIMSMFSFLHSLSNLYFDLTYLLFLIEVCVFRRPVPHDELKKLGIPLPPEGRYMSRYEIPPLPRRQIREDCDHRQSQYRSIAFSRSDGDALDSSQVKKLNRHKPIKQMGSSVLENDEQELGGTSDAKDPKRYSDDVWQEKAGDRDVSIHADNEEHGSKHGSYRHHRHRSHTDRHTTHHHEIKRKKRSPEHRRSSNPDQVFEDKRKRQRHEDYDSGYK